ncbi:hypothetical protein [Kitasatospora purpeofusca]|uniref:hypothetical protein n=1 Tax=Kitasatospora purpeofusca TaxID=67352 RepID=UPI002251A25A|nr:hypothetical protein [Kitasatospora purpeofusca]MCX4755338.1 hypothetical protein [Kitasatospora purpeofusca]WSR36787.1 hypothetical protein OG715_40970 [Kitasatospora purpeofusca]
MHSPVDSNSDAPGLDLDRPLPLRRLVYLEEADEVTIGSPETDTYAVFPADGAELVRMLADGLTPREVAERYRTAHGESVDIADLIEVLAELDLFRPADAPTAETAPVRWQRLGGLLFGRPALLGYALVTVLAAVEMVRVPALVPRTDNLFFTTSYTLVVLLLFFGQAPLLALHEAFHALAGRRLGLRSRLSVGHRLVYLVLETSLDGLVSVPRRKRYLPILAGMLADVLAIAVLTLIADVTRGGAATVARLCLAIAYATVLRLAWQGFFYLRTDLYVLLSTALGCVNLHAAAVDVLRSTVRRVTGRPPVDLEAHHPVDRRVARWYAWLMVVGYAFTLTMFAGVVVPTAYRLLHDVWLRMTGQGSTAARLDSIVLLLLSLGQTAAVVVLAVRERRAARRPAPARTA